MVPAIVLASGERAAAGVTCTQPVTEPVVRVCFDVIPGLTGMEFFDGNPVPLMAQLSNQLQLSEGVSLSSPPMNYVALVNLDMLGSGHAISPPNGIGGVNAENRLKYDSPVFITFTLPGNPSTPAITDLVSIRGDQRAVPGAFATMEAFDVNGVSLGSVTASDVAGGLTLRLSIANIHAVLITQGVGSLIAFDDLTFNPLSSHVAHAPIANAGPDQSIHAGQLVTLDGTGSFDDNTATENLVFAWTLTGKPEGSSATLSRPDTSRPSFVADLPGVYTASLIVKDVDGLSSAPDTVVVSSLNGAPVADAGPDRGTFVGDVVTLNGSMSRDPDLDPLAFSWTLATPARSAAVLAGKTTAFPTFTPDVPGSYTGTLTVKDPFGAVATDSVVVSVVTGAQFAENQAVSALNFVGALTPEQVTNRGNQNALQAYLTQAIAALQDGEVDEARKKLTKTLERTDGCALRKIPDGDGQDRDWVTDCAAQAILYPILTVALDALTP
jgi:hypothetical protein